jgi:hypothetical protein
MPSLFRRKSSDLVTDAVDEANARARTTRSAASGGRPTRTVAAKATTTRTTTTRATGGTVTKRPGAKATTTTVTKTTAKTAATKATPAKATTLRSTTLDADDTSARRGHTPSKRDLGQSTPKRRVDGRIVEAPPANRREAWRRSREKQRETRAEQRAGMLAGKDEFLMKRDRGPERAYVRDIVDSRRNFASLFMPLALVVILGTAVTSPTIRTIANTLWYLMALGIVVDSILLTRKVKQLMPLKFPKDPNKPRSYYAYAIMRALSPRRLRTPAARFRAGDEI